MDCFELKIDKRKFQQINSIWNELRLNSPFSVGYVTNLIESRSFKNKEEWENFYYESGLKRKELVENLSDEQKILLNENSYKNVDANIIKINTDYGRTRECFYEKANILFEKAKSFGLSLEECFECVRYRVICETWNGIRIREENTIKFLRDNYNLSFVKTEGDVDYKYSVDYEVFKGEELVFGIQINPKSYLGESSYIKKSNLANKKKNDLYTSEKGVPVLVIISEYNGNVINKEVLSFFNFKNKISVVNKKTHTPTENDFYIGRGSPLGNPFTHITTKETKADFLCETRYQAIEKYKEYIGNKIKKRDNIVCDELNKIWLAVKKNDVNLVCYCAPNSCHGNYIKNIIESKL